MKTLSIDIETYSDIPLQKSGVYRYCESPNFEILLFGYSADSGPVQVVDLACGEKIPADVLDALTDGAVTKWAFNASFERVILNNARIEWVSLYLGRQPYRGISKLSDQWTEAEDFDGCENDVHLYKVREMETNPLLQRLIDAYEADYPEVDHVKA